MNLDNIFEDLETQYESLQVAPKPSLETLGSATVFALGQCLQLHQVHYAKDFIMGRRDGSLYAITHQSLKHLDLKPGPGGTSNQTLKRWVAALPERTWLRVHVGGAQHSGHFHFTGSGLLIIGTRAVAVAAIDQIEIRAVEN